jgi:hypothetical protein
MLLEINREFEKHLKDDHRDLSVFRHLPTEAEDKSTRNVEIIINLAEIRIDLSRVQVYIILFQPETDAAP